MNQKLKDLLNNQINKELYSAYLYLDIADFFAKEGLDGFESYYRIQAEEEYLHASKIIKYLIDNQQEVNLEKIDKPQFTALNYNDILYVALNHEKYITESINNIYSFAEEIKDYRTRQMLDWFIAEQAEEESNAEDLITKLKLYDKGQQELYLLNQELKQRKKDSA